MKQTLFDTCTAVLLVTEKIYAFLGIVEPFVVRNNKDVIFAIPSENFWSPMKVEGWGCKLIDNMLVESFTPMLEDMKASESPWHELMAITSGNRGAKIKESQEVPALNAAKTYPGMLSIVWNGDGVKIFTAAFIWQARRANTEAVERVVA